MAVSLCLIIRSAHPQLPQGDLEAAQARRLRTGGVERRAKPRSGWSEPGRATSTSRGEPQWSRPESGLDEVEEVDVELLLHGALQSVRASRVDGQGRLGQQRSRLGAGRLDRDDLVV